jgi:anti-sigma factor RsiW
MKIDGENLQEPCPAPERLGAYVEGKLTSEEKALIESHLVKCNPCREERILHRETKIFWRMAQVRQLRLSILMELRELGDYCAYLGSDK